MVTWKRVTENKESLVIVPPSLQGERAGFVTRLIAFVIDLLIITGTSTVVAGIAGLILNFFNIDFIQVATDSSADLSARLPGLILLGAYGLFNLVLFLAYAPFFWLVAGQTPGKAIMGLRVITLDGKPLRLHHAVRRMAGYWISAIPFFLGYLWVLIDDGRRAWHDKIAGTQVVYSWEARAGVPLAAAALEGRRKQLEEEN
jgi:uncharacterized RDD family membrane protein YckC